MDKYELAVVLDAALPQDQKESIVKETSDAINKANGKIINSQVWIDKHKLSFRLKKCWEATYYLVNLESPRSGIVTLQKTLGVNERILRFLLTKAK